MEVIIIKNLLTTKELQEEYKVTRQAIVNWRKEGMPFKKLGKLVRFESEQVRKWLLEKGDKLSND